MRVFRYLVVAGLLGAAVSAQAAPVTYKLDPDHTMVLFSWNHFGYSNPTADLGLSEG
ncbi:MAG TPA: polyisoprenoid-binding protein, partial [Rhodanobacter sp.]|nr:polyisoprenoid-binding protein [Rhodanobacter sp.]